MRLRAAVFRPVTIVFDNRELLPPAWRTAQDAAVRTFNPGLIRDGAGWLLAYRVVTEPALQRRIALCRLDAEFRVASAPMPLSDGIRFSHPELLPAQATHWFADPRLYRFGKRLFVYWNSGWHEPQNCQFLQELEPTTLRSIGAPRELMLRAGRQKLEKNWGLFECDGALYAIYSVNPHRVLTFSVGGEGPIACEDAAPPTPNPGGFAQIHGGLRGGAPPQQVCDHFYSFCHSIENGPSGYEYVPSVYRFDARPPFAPTDMPRCALPIALPHVGRRQLPKLNPAIGDIVYPSGAAYAEGKWVVSLGVDDEHCAVAILDHAAVLATLAPVSSIP